MRNSITPILKLITILLLCSHLPFKSNAQQIEEVSLDSFFVGTVNTYLTDINDAGFVAGYYDSAGTTNGFAGRSFAAVVCSNETRLSNERCYDRRGVV